jgi:SAM-dependent MidA family methyltransferase
MSLGKPALVEAIRAEINAAGAIPFERFMEQALYHPEYGYYVERRSPHIGRYGDFYTNVSVSGLFGQLMGQQFEQMWEVLGCPDDFRIVEQGANDGRFAADVLRWMREWNPELWARTQYWILEPIVAARQVQEATLQAAGCGEKVVWSEGLDGLAAGSMTGVFFSNELVDSFPVHLIIYRRDSWKELYVEWAGDGFRLVDGDFSSGELAAAVAVLPLHRVQRYTTEVNLRARRWIRQAANLFRAGFILTVDYGYDAENYYNAKRIDGTLLCYHEHRKSANALIRIGEQDITAHVDFSALACSGEEAGLAVVGFTDQHHFMVGLAQDDLATFEASGQAADPHFRDTVRAFKTLMHPELMGSSFKFLVQAKGLEALPALDGLRFARNAVL